MTGIACWSRCAACMEQGQGDGYLRLRQGRSVKPSGAMMRWRGSVHSGAADPKGKDFSIYRGATADYSELAEFETVVGHCETARAGAGGKGLALIEQLELEPMLVTRSEQGIDRVAPG